NPIMLIDTNGDGTVDKQTQTTSTLTGATLTDNTPPVTSANNTGTAGTQGWFKSNVNVTLSAQDTGAGILKTYYFFDSEQTPREYSGAITVSKEGTTRLWYFSTDKAGNAEKPKFFDIKL